MKNVDDATVDGFGREWAAYDQTGLDREQAHKIFEEYFHIFPWERLPPNAMGFDLGCGSGRWAGLVAPRVGELHCIDASVQALNVAKENLRECTNVCFHLASVESSWLGNETADFGYSLGVLHHVPDTAAALRSCAAKLKRGAPFLLYLYYRFDTRPRWFRALWRCSDYLRRFVWRMPFAMRLAITKLIALIVYWPLARLGRLLGKAGVNTSNWPLAYYQEKSFYVMQTDALDRFGTKLEKRFTKVEIEELLEISGFTDAQFSDRAPFWCVVAYKS